MAHHETEQPHFTRKFIINILCSKIYATIDVKKLLFNLARKNKRYHLELIESDLVRNEQSIANF